MREMIHHHAKKHKNFLIYFSVGLFMAALNVFFLWLMIDIWRIPTVLSSTVVVGSIFLMKFWVYKKTGFTQ